MDSDSALANVLEIVIPALGVALLVTVVVVPILKGRWWMGVVGLPSFIVGFVVGFGAFGVPEPSDEFQETALFGVLNVTLNVLFWGGATLLLLGAFLKPRPGSWWDHKRRRDATSS